MEEVFQDEVIRATDLNRSSGEVLTRAARAPITIIRNDESFALMRREVAAHWKREASSAIHIAEVMANALRAANDVDPEYHWIRAFEKKTILQMTDELIAAYRKADRDGNWDEFDAVLHEWSESGWAALSSELQSAFTSEKAPIAISDPDLATIE